MNRCFGECERDEFIARIEKLKAENAEQKKSLAWAMANVSGDFDAQNTEYQNEMYRKAAALLEAEGK